jgi:hypothetical protein
MVDPVSVALKFGFLLVLYLFLLWVARSVLKDLRTTDQPPKEAEEGGAWARNPDATGLHAAVDGLGPGRELEGEPRLQVERAPGLSSGSTFDLGAGAVLGRGEMAEIQLDDPYASSRHARIIWEGALPVLEDLGSTNGTYLNGEAVDGPKPLHVGDRIRIGDSEFSYLT